MKCKHCGLTEDKHHLFEPMTFPSGCVCDPMDWDHLADIPAPCERFDGGGIKWCRRCEHDEACHRRR